MTQLRLALPAAFALLAACGGLERAPIGGRDAGAQSPADAGSAPYDSGVEWNGMPSRNIIVRTVLDGDTIIVGANQTVRTPDGRPMDGEKVRLIGVDAPEIAHGNVPADCWGDAAHDFTRDTIGGRIVTLEWDTSKCNPPGEVTSCRDDYGRLLAYVVIAGEVLNETLITTGNARVFHGARFRHQDSARYDALEAEARASGVGLWSCP